MLSLDTRRFCLDSVNVAVIREPSAILLKENLCVMVYPRRVNSMEQSTASIGAHPANHTDASCWALLSLGARSEFSTSINHRVPNGRLSFGMRPIAEGAAVEAVAEAALIA